MSNIAEGFNAGSEAEFMRFLSFSRRSISETQSEIVALDRQYISQDLFNKIYEKANETEKQINALIGYFPAIKLKKINLSTPLTCQSCKTC